MPLFVIFVFASIIFGAGAMLSPALLTRSPRIGLAGALTLAFITAGSIFYAGLFGWNTLIIDYMWFAALVGIFLAGTLSAGMYRAEASGGTKTYSGWPGPRELAFFALVALICAAPALVLPVPLDTDAQGFGYLALTLRSSGSLTTLAPFHPEVTYLYSPGFPALIAYLSERLNAGIQAIQLAVGAVLSMLFVWVAYDFGNELYPGESRRPGIVMACCALLGTGLLTADLDSHYTALLGLVFSLAFLTFVIRFHREGRRGDFLAAAITLAGVPLSQPDMTIILMLAYVPWLATMWLTEPRPDFRRWLGLAAGIPLLAVIGLAPWLGRILPLLGANIRSPFETNLSHLIVMLIYQGGLIVVLALVGIVLARRRRNAVDWLMFVWLILVIDFSSLGILKTIGGGLLTPILKYDYPFSIAWHGPIIPYMYFGATAILWLMEKIPDAAHRIRKISLLIMGAAALIILVCLVFSEPLLVFSKSTPLMLYGAFSSQADVRAMQWLEQNTPQDTLILNHPGLYEADWAPVVAQRNTVFFRLQPFFLHTEKVETMQNDLRAFWRSPADPGNAALLAKYGVGYVIVPQVFNRPDSLREMFRWRPPLPDAAAYQVVGDAPSYLELVFDADGAQVYRVRGNE